MGNLVKAPGSELWATLEALDHAGMTPEDAAELRRDKKLAEQLVAIFRTSDQSITLPSTCPVTVDYDQPLPDQISDGKYDWFNSDISAEHFSCAEHGVRKLEFALVHLNRVATTDDVLKFMDDNGLRPATLEELLAFGAQHSEYQRQYPIVALGSVWRCDDGNRGVPYLGVDDGKRKLNLNWLGIDWRDYCRFLAVRK